jgi:hypothetical protein
MRTSIQHIETRYYIKCFGIQAIKVAGEVRVESLLSQPPDSWTRDLAREMRIRL